MHYERIFWLDDNPWFLDKFSTFHNLDLAPMLRRVTFAHDFEDGRRIVEEREFDLYILDADFPKILDSTRKQNLIDKLDYLRRREKAVIGLYPQDNTVENYFLDFYEENLDKNMKVVVYSISENAPKAALKLGLPFYSKSSSWETSKKIKERMRMVRPDLEISEDELEVLLRDWECGSSKMFVDTYLL